MTFVLSKLTEFKVLLTSLQVSIILETYCQK